MQEKRTRRVKRGEFANLDHKWFREQLRRVALRSMYPHVFDNQDREVGGVIVGSKDKSGLPMIHASIPAMQADEQRATLTFTQESWENVHRIMDSHYEGCEIVGWYHSHPGFGIFLSEHDLFIHRNFFGDISQVAYVIDPVAGTEGIFTWQDGDVKELFEQPTAEGWAIVPLDRLDREDRSQGRAKMAAIPLIIALVVGILGGLLIRGSLSSDDPGQPEGTAQGPALVTGSAGTTSGREANAGEAPATTEPEAEEASAGEAPATTEPEPKPEEQTETQPDRPPATPET